MTKKLLSIIALGTALAVIAAGTATSVTVDLGGGVTVDVPPGGALPQCADLSDNDGDGAADLNDPGCSGSLDTSEYDAPAPAPAPAPEPGAPATGAPTGPGSTGGKLRPDGAGAKGGVKGAPQGKAAPGKGLFGKRLPKGGKGSVAAERAKIEAPGPRNPDGSPSNSNPGLTIASFGAAPIGVPNFVIDQFEIPPFLLPIYQACGTEYGVPWQVLASINRIETAFGTNLNVSSAGAMGWMQFIPSSWRAYGVDANEDGRKDPYNPVDAICAAARYLKAAGAGEDLRGAIFAYNHADWYVDEVLLYANQYGKLPDDLVGSLTGLTEGAHFPVAADARYADDISEREALKRSRAARSAPGNAADVISASPTRRGIDIYSRAGAPVVAVNDGVITKLGRSPRLGRYIVLMDAYGNRYTYAQLGEISASYPVPKQKPLTARDFEIVSPKGERRPAAPASAGDTTPAPSKSSPKQAKEAKAAGPAAPLNTEQLRERLFALPERPANVERAGLSGQLEALLGKRVPAYETFKSYFSGVFRFDARTMELRTLKVGSKVTGGTILGRIGASAPAAPHVNFSIRPAGRGAPKIDPKPILDGWKLLETTAIYRAAGKDPFGGSEATIGQVLLMSKASLMQRVLADPRIEIYACGRSDIESGQIDRRTLAALSYLSERGYRLTITSLKCGHSFYTTSGNVSAHSSGNAVDIAQVNGLPILGNQGRGSITEAVVRDLMALQGTMLPSQIITLMDLGGPTFAMGDHDDHIHVGYTPLAGGGRGVQQLAQVLRPEQWGRLIDRLGEIENPKVPAKPSEASLPADRGSAAHRGE
ncbi:MAG TPA: lytic murein transglycosylase [Solirubrobacterales bacterium]|nr:lytic murein transglycosylase [Solirubrobacterales bacterium]